jgi:biopolymer transport protein ExbB
MHLNRLNPLRFIPHRLLLGAIAVLTLSATANAWWDGDWSIRKKIVIDTTDKGVAIDNPIGATAVLLRLSDADFQFQAAKDDGSDIRFVADDDKTLLTYHIESIDTLLNQAFVWVKIPEIKPGAQTTFWMYYGNSGNKAVKVEDPKGTYDSNTVLVYHFNEKGSPFNDSSGNSNGTKAAGVSAGALIGNGMRLTGHAPVTVPASASLQVFAGGALTWEAWVKPTTLAANSIIFSRHDGPGGLVIGLDNGIPFAEITANGTTLRTTAAGAALAVNTWHHIALTAAPGKVTFYVDGDPYGAPLATSLPALNSDLIFGADPSGVRPGFVGDVDELEISKNARTDGFIKFAASSQAGNDSANKLVSVGADEQTSTWLSGNSTFGILIRSLTPDGWAVICLLTVMAIVSWTVMFTKASYLNKNAKGSDHFLRAWRHVAADLTALDSGDMEHAKSLGGRVDKKGQKVLRHAAIYRIYHTGVEEIRHRMSAPGYEGKVLSAQSIQAIRASLDGVMVREQQQLNKLMVFLTIAISGGPFLGLLGTVVGVMITFAAIAAAGDVNVNAIAPGIAAALLATVAGLAVAIPALFGYNYLISRIKDSTTDMHVFVDEFVTKLAEFYRPRRSD